MSIAKLMFWQNSSLKKREELVRKSTLIVAKLSPTVSQDGEK